MDIIKEQEFNFLKMDIRERCAALNNKLDQMTFTDLRHADNQELLTNLYDHIVGSGAALLKFIHDKQSHNKKKAV